MGRSLRSKRLRCALYLAADGKCCICGCELKSDWHADHIVPWSVTKRTNVHEMQALCPTCNFKKGDLMTIWALENEDDVAHRNGHIHAIKLFRKWIAEGCPFGCFSIYMCCRYGKSDTIRNLALLALAQRKASSALVVHPGTTLAKQFLEQKRLMAWRSRWMPSGPRLHKVSTLSEFGYQTMCDDEWIGSIHIQAVIQPMQRALLMQWVDKCHARDGLKPIIFFDEAHQFSGENTWGDLARDLHSAGCLVVVLTATPFRNDKDDVFGFKKKSISDPVSRELTYVMPSMDPSMIEVHKITRDETEFLIEADVEVPFSQGWQDGCIAKCTFDLIDWHMEGWGDGREGDSRMLSEVPKKEARSVLPSLYRDPSAIDEAVRRALMHLKSFRKGAVKDATIVWYGMNDDSSNKESSENQKIIKNAILAQDSSLSVAIATQSEDKKSEDKSAEIIMKFCDPQKKHSDVLVLKQMGSMGLDSDRVCVVVLWNTVRSLGQMVQMAMRGGNIGNKSHFVIIALADSMTKDRLESFVAGEGGKYIESIETDHTVELVERKEGQVSGYIPVQVADTGMSDSDGVVASFDDIQLALVFVHEFPETIANWTLPQIAGKARKMGVTASDSIDETPFVNTNEMIDKLCENLKAYVQKIGSQRFKNRNRRISNGSKEDRAEYGRLYREVASDIKKRSGIFGSWDKSKKDRSLTLSDYQKWTSAADSIYEEACVETYTSNLTS